VVVVAVAAITAAISCRALPGTCTNGPEVSSPLTLVPVPVPVLALARLSLPRVVVDIDPVSVSVSDSVTDTFDAVDMLPCRTCGVKASGSVHRALHFFLA
jgi:hypothetical protein